MPPRAFVGVCALVLAACAAAPPFVDTTLPAPSTAPGTVTEPPTTLLSTTEPAVTEPKDPLTQQVEELMRVTSEIRRLEFLATPHITFLTDEGVAERLLELFDEELDVVQYAAYDELYTVLGLLPSDADLLELIRAMQTEQVVAFYDTDSKELVAPLVEEALSPTEKLTMVHELTHALTDQHFDLFSIMDRLDTEQRYDEASAFRALVEGDATVVEIVYLQELPRDEQLAILQEVLGFESPIFDASPQFLQDSLLFPYVQGRELVTGIWAADGFSGVDESYSEYPTTTENVYQLGTYFAGEGARAVNLPALAFDGYELIESSTWGYLGFQTMFDQVLTGAVADEATEGWGGDAYELHWSGRDVVLVLIYLGDTEQEAVELHDALTQFVAASMRVGPASPDGAGTVYRGDDYAFVSRLGDSVLFVAASSPTAGENARITFPEF